MRTALSIAYKNEPELTAIYKILGRKDFINFIKDALRWVVRPSYVGKVRIPSIEEIASVHQENEKYRIDICIVSEKDEDIRYFLQNANNRMICKLIRECAKLYLGTVGLSAYLNEEMAKHIQNARAPQTVYAIGAVSMKNTVPRSKPQIRKPRPVSKPTNKPVEPAFTPQPIQPEINTYEAPPIQKEPVTDMDDALSLLNSLLG